MDRGICGDNEAAGRCDGDGQMDKQKCEKEDTSLLIKPTNRGQGWM